MYPAAKDEVARWLKNLQCGSAYIPLNDCLAMHLTKLSFTLICIPGFSLRSMKTSVIYNTMKYICLENWQDVVKSCETFWVDTFTVHTLLPVILVSGDISLCWNGALCISFFHLLGWCSLFWINFKNPFLATSTMLGVLCQDETRVLTMEGNRCASPKGFCLLSPLGFQLKAMIIHSPPLGGFLCTL